MKSEIVTEELTRLYERDGDIRASVLVDESRPDDAPLHEHFEWDDDVAAEQFRLTQARKLIRVAVIRTPESARTRVHHVPAVRGGEREGAYKPATVIAETSSDWQRAYHAVSTQAQALERSMRELWDAARIEERGDEDLARIGAAITALETARTALQLH